MYIFFLQYIIAQGEKSAPLSRDRLLKNPLTWYYFGTEKELCLKSECSIGCYGKAENIPTSNIRQESYGDGWKIQIALMKRLDF